MSAPVAKRVSDAVSAVIRAGPAYGLAQPVSVEWRGARCQLPQPGPQSAPVFVDFSSVNVAKPLHAGHLRATVLGNFVVQINRAFGHRVIGINYLGDWGRQFALLLAGMESFGRPELLGSEDDQQVSEQVSRLAVQHMQSVYARAGTELPAEAVESAYARLESGEPQAMRLWRLAKRHSLAELDACYRRLSVSFDRLEFESDYAKQTGKLLALLDRRGLLAAAPDGAKLLRLADSADDEAVVQKRDGSSLYFGRDLLAALDRADNLGCGRAHYVVESAQRLHFDRLGRALTALGRPDLANPSPWPMHVEFGRVEGMSTRRSGSGGVVLLRDILDVGQARMLERSKASPNRRIDGSDASSIADRLAASVVAMEMMRVRRLQPVKFSWDSDNSAVGAQYCHARLCSLASKAAKAGISSPDDGSSIDLALNLVGPKAATAANELAEQLLAYPDTALEAFLTYEPCVLVAYTNRLVSRANACLRVLPVLTCAKDSGAIGRLALFNSTRSVLASAMRLVGLTPMLSI
ncbi:hypothetical protein BOX15_Mlig006116g1 [Macrostomum lignano]|uniref:Probable arginine--tRNA ligase, mitochondrial n=1 Tax=Macrostomum lignano TaxID=282301 RepID=A0A267FCF8_9PLAT|nr:hypothetical protein BOX15_Mlig006116g1 [Macrostomum lignano]